MNLSMFTMDNLMIKGFFMEKVNIDEFKDNYSKSQELTEDNL